MKFSISNIITATACLLSSTVSAQGDSKVPDIVIKGNKFFYSNNGTQFFMRGIAYQQELANATAETTFSDPLADPDACKRDLPYLTALRTNVLRVYAVDTTKNHDECINLFAENGIYIVADLSEPGLSINRDSPEWSVDLYNRYTQVVDELQVYPNVLGFFAGNEVTNNKTNTDASPFVKAAIRDVKAYIKEKGYRQIPVGYSTNDDAETRDYLADYFDCGSREEAADFYGYNMYEWCGNKVDFESSGYQERTEEFANYTIPVFFSEYGCNVPQPREFNDVPSLYSDNMTDVWSGGIVYMYFEEANNYGLVSIEADGSVSTLPDYNQYSTKINKVNPTGVNSASFTPTNTVARDCPASTLKAWKAASSLPPTPQQGVCECMSNSLACVIGDNVDEKDYGDVFAYVCGQVSCDGVNANGTTGEYGAFSFCSPKDKLSFVLNLYYNSQNKNSQACDFDGKAHVVSPKKLEDSCQDVLSQAGAEGTNPITNTADLPKATGSTSSSPSKDGSSGSSEASSSGSSSSSQSSSGSKNGAMSSYNNWGLNALIAMIVSLFIGVVTF